MSKKIQTPVELLRKKYFKAGMLYETDFAEAIEIENKYKQKLADDAFRLGLETGKVFKSIEL